MDILGGVLLYAGLLGFFVGLLCVLKPLRFLGIRSRKAALAVAGAAAALFAIGIYLPIDHNYVINPVLRTDRLMPVYQFREFHSEKVAAPADRVYAAIREVEPEEIRFYRALTWIRRASKKGEGVLNPPAGRPILDTFTRAFHVLADDPPDEIILGSAMQRPGGPQLTADNFAEFRADRVVKILFNFRVKALDAGHSLLTTETRMYAAGPGVERAFAAYWRLIRPGSALIRRSWLRAIRDRAERAPDLVSGLRRAGCC